MNANRHANQLKRNGRLSRRGAVLTEHDYMIRRVRDQVFRSDEEFEHFDCGSSDLSESRTLDYLFATTDDPHEPDAVFDRMRWGGQFVFASRNADEAQQLAERYAKTGFVLERGPERVAPRLMGVKLVGFGPRIYFFVARKVLLVRPHEYSERFTYDVHLERFGDDYVVAKQIPTVEGLTERLKLRAPSMPIEEVRKQAGQLVNTIFPVFLTREVAFLQILQRDLPEEYRCRVPEAVDVEKDERGMVCKLKLNWLRKTDKTMSQIDFAVQAADLLHKLHHYAKIIHLDLRLDNFVITDHGVGFVDFGSAARAGENIEGSAMLRQLFAQLMRTSQVQRVLDKLVSTGRVTAEYLMGARHKVDRAADVFYLAFQVDKPHTNPYTNELVRYDRTSEEAHLIANMCTHVLRPNDPRAPLISSAREMLRGLEEIRDHLSAGSAANARNTRHRGNPAPVHQAI